MSCFRRGTLCLLMLLSVGPLYAEPPQQLTFDGTMKFAPAFEGHEAIVYAVHREPTAVVLERLEVASGDITRVHQDVAAHQLDPAFSADGRIHCYSKSESSPQMVLVIQDREAQTQTEFRPREARAIARRPSIDSAAGRIVFHVSDVNGHQIASVDFSGGDLQLLTQSTGINAFPAVSPDGGRIAFSSSRDDDTELYVMDSDGENVTRLTHSPGLDTRPAWSPDGQHIAFTSNRDGDFEIYTMASDGSDVRRFTTAEGQDDFATWHPSGTQLVIVGERRGGRDLYIYDVAP